MLEKLKQILSILDEAIRYNEASDMAYTDFYVELKRKRKAIAKAVKAFERIERHNG